MKTGRRRSGLVFCRSTIAMPSILLRPWKRAMYIRSCPPLAT
ncbi:hypothetical protein CSPX01_09412 [Colletotrichum filicis]|nr:hypothetical protein CSPX01_09412 [Colletotrichum filicis]